MCFNPSPERRVPSPNRYMAFAKFCFCKNNKRMIDREGRKSWELLSSHLNLHFPTGSAGKGKEREPMQSAKIKPRSAVDEQGGDPIANIINDCVKRELNVKDWEVRPSFFLFFSR
jgi:hypothetical protein